MWCVRNPRPETQGITGKKAHRSDALAKLKHSICIYIYICMYLYIYVCTYIYMSISIYLLSIYSCLQIYISPYIYIGRCQISNNSFVIVGFVPQHVDLGQQKLECIGQDSSKFLKSLSSLLPSNCPVEILMGRW